MSNVVPFPTQHHSTNSEGTRAPAFHDHAVQFYEQEDFLLRCVTDFLGTGLSKGERLLVIATASHRAAFRRSLRARGGESALKTGGLVFIDAHEALAEFMIDEVPDATRFNEFIERLLAQATAGAAAPATVRAFGEMVDVLWKRGNRSAAIQLEELWNEAGKRHAFSLLCAYAMGNFYKESDQAEFFAVCRNHGQVMPTEAFGEVDDGSARLREIALLQQRACSLEAEVQHRKELEAALRDALRERGHAEAELSTAVARERQARKRAEASDAFKEQFMGILGHDLRNPLNTVLTTARLMILRRELPEESRGRLDRIVVSGIRMQRMIDQLLDLTRARHAGGIALNRKEQDLVPLVAKIVEETRLAHPSRVIELDASMPCLAAIDGDRFEQVVSNLLGNAVTHGDAARPIRVTAQQPASVVVHNFGPAIDPELMPLLFTPFERGDKPSTCSDGLGLGLYISEIIVKAHGGTIHVTSSHDAGTRFEASFLEHA